MTTQQADSGWTDRSEHPRGMVAEGARCLRCRHTPTFDLTAVCTTRQESADEAMAAFNAGSAWDNYNRMLADADINAATISLRVPSHYEPTMASLRAGKHTFTEWPLGRTTAEAVEMAEVARQQGVKTAVGVQARANPAIIHLRNLVADGYVGRVMACHVRLMREGVLSRVSGRTWQRDVELGAKHPDHRLRTHHRRAVQRSGRVRGRGHSRQHPGSHVA